MSERNRPGFLGDLSCSVAGQEQRGPRPPSPHSTAHFLQLRARRPGCAPASLWKEIHTKLTCRNGCSRCPWGCSDLDRCDPPCSPSAVPSAACISLCSDSGSRTPRGWNKEKWRGSSPPGSPPGLPGGGQTEPPPSPPCVVLGLPHFVWSLRAFCFSPPVDSQTRWGRGGDAPLRGPCLNWEGVSL